MTRPQPIRHRECEECGTRYQLKNTLSRYCSGACKQRAFAKRHPNYGTEAHRRYLQKPEKSQRRRAYMQAYNQRPGVIARRNELVALAYARDPEPLKARVRARQLGYRVAHTHQEWLARLAEYRYRCAYCGRNDVRLTKDHIVPISRGDPETVDQIENIAPACRSCNGRKGNRLVEELLHPSALS